MADVFLSYKSEDRAQVQRLADALVADGLTVWWDAHIEGGAGWRKSIQRELEAARCVVVVWSQRSVGDEGEFVHEEATYAKRRGAYLPVRIDPVAPPLGFGETQTLSLLDWHGERTDPAYQSLLAGARAVVEGTPRPASVSAPSSSFSLRIGRRTALIGGGVVAAGAVAAGGWALLRGGRGPESDSIAVLPFENLSGDPAQAYFSDGIAEELRSALARIAALKVAARNSSEQFRNASDAKKAAVALGVANILIGSVRRSPQTIRVTAQLVDGATGLERWSQSFDRPAGDALAVQTDIAENVAGALKIRFGGAEKAALTLGGTKVAAAQDALLRAWAIPNGNLADQRRRLALFDVAIAADPGFATAYAARAATLGNIAIQASGAERAAALAGLQKAAEHAVALAPDLAYVQAIFGLALSSQLDYRGADRAYRRALALGAGDPLALSNVAGFFDRMGRADEALAIIDRAIALDPLNDGLVNEKVGILYLARRYGDAVELAQRLLSKGFEDDELLEFFCAALVFSGKAQDALKYAARITDNEGRSVQQAIAAAHLQDKAASDQALAALTKFSDDEVGTDLAAVYAQRGEADRAMAALDRAVAIRHFTLLLLRADPMFDPLRSDPRFGAIIAKLNFP